MSREKANFRDVVADIVEVTGKRELGINDVKKFLKIGQNKAVEYMDGKKKITVYEFAQKLL